MKTLILFVLASSSSLAAPTQEQCIRLLQNYQFSVRQMERACALDRSSRDCARKSERAREAQSAYLASGCSGPEWR